MKSQIHEHQKNNLFSVSKKVLMLALLVLGTTAMVNAQTAPAKDAKAAPAKEVKATKKATKKAAPAKKVEATPAAAPAKK